MKQDAIVIGQGLFGSVIAQALREQDLNVVTVDDVRPQRGSNPAACLMKPSWFSGLGREIYEPALQLLDDLYGVHDIRFKIGINLVHGTVHWADPAKILQPPTLKASVTSVERGSEGHYRVRLYNPELGREATLSAPLCVVATGIWVGELVQGAPTIAEQAGAAYLWPDAKVQEPFIKPWAPYKQLVAFNRGDGAWVGDGTSIKWDNWTEQRESESAQRCMGAVGFTQTPKRLFGVRPYVKGAKPAYLDEPQPGLWLATGGAKNGTLAAGWCAHEIVRKIAGAGA
jgi:glycine/D-amino acid oxidase-like deaminating enzyme